MPAMKGGCLCGSVRYTANAEPIMTAICHCNDCQLQAGSAFSVVVGVPRPALTLEGQYKTFKGEGGSGKPTYRHFCPECGSPLFTEVDIMPDVAFIKAGTLDDRVSLRPTMEIWCDTAWEFTRTPTEITQFARMPG
jgi:hypothetical protein